MTGRASAADNSGYAAVSAWSDRRPGRLSADNNGYAAVSA